MTSNAPFAQTRACLRHKFLNLKLKLTPRVPSVFDFQFQLASGAIDTVLLRGMPFAAMMLLTKAGNGMPSSFLAGLNSSNPRATRASLLAYSIVARALVIFVRRAAACFS